MNDGMNGVDLKLARWARGNPKKGYNFGEKKTTEKALGE